MGELLRKHISHLSSSSSDYRTALNVLIKYEIQCLLERLSSTGEEAVVITTSEDVGCPGFLGSIKGEKFIEDNKTVSLLHSQLVNFCKDGRSKSPCDEEPSTPTVSAASGSNDGDVAGDTGPDWPGSDHVTLLPSNDKHVTSLPSNHHVTLHGDENMNRLPCSARMSPFRSLCHGNCFREECLCRFKHLERNTTMSKKHMSMHPKFSWEEEKMCLFEKTGISMCEDKPMCSKSRLQCEGDCQTIDLTCTDPESDTSCSLLNRTTSSHMKDMSLGINGNSNDEVMMSAYNGLFGARCHVGYRYPMADIDSDDNQALDYSMSTCRRKSMSKERCDTKTLCENVDSCDKDDSCASETCALKEMSTRSKAYPFLTKELFSSKSETAQRCDIEKSKTDYENENCSASVEEMNPEKSKCLLNDLYLPSVVKSEPCDDYVEMSEMQYMCASRLLRHTELPSSPLQLKFTCKTCGEVFKNRQYRDLHVKLHESAHKFMCTVCGIGFDVEDEYQSHQKMHCEPLLVCQDCGYRCTREFRMKSHREICGQPSKVYKCPFCNKPFAAKRYMNIHMKSHDVRNVNPCPFCPNVYPLKNSLLKHIKKKHGVSKME